MYQEPVYTLRVVWACMKKDIKSALTDRVFTIVGVFVPVNILILLSLFVLAGSQAPTAVVMHVSFALLMPRPRRRGYCLIILTWQLLSPFPPISHSAWMRMQTRPSM